MRKEYFIPLEKEVRLISRLSSRLVQLGFNASNTIVVTVSSDYSAIVGQLLRHDLSFEGEIAEGFSVDVPYPDETWRSAGYISKLHTAFSMNAYDFDKKTLLLVEAGAIRSSNYIFLTDWIKENYPEAKVKTLAVFENSHSNFERDFVGEYYDNELQDLTFSWEKPNKHF